MISDYVAEFKKRIDRLNKLNDDPYLVLCAKEYYKNNPVAFI